MKKRERNSLLKFISVRSTAALLTRQNRPLNAARRWLAMGLMGWSLLVSVGAYASDMVVQEFYLPMPESQVYEAFNKQIAYDPSDVNMMTIFSIVVTTPGTVIVYDQWEDGYEANINAPTDVSTQVWGDANDANGICPGFASDPSGLPPGTVITLKNEVPAPVRGNAVLYDAGDRVGATRAITISRVCYENYQRLSAQASAVEVISTLDHGKFYVAPVGVDTLANGMFTYVDLLVMADNDNTTVVIDFDGSGTTLGTNIIDRGAHGAFLMDDVRKGATVKSDKPVQVQMITGNAFTGQFETRSFALRPVELWSSKYIIPVGTIDPNYPGFAYVFNPNATALSVTFTTRTGTGSFSVPGANGLFPFQLPAASATLLESVDGSPFFVICPMNTDPVGYSGTFFEWGYTPLPFEGLTTELVCGWGPGADVSLPEWNGTQNGNPVWITAVSDTTLFIDFDGDGLYVTNVVVSALETTMITDLSDNDQTGMRVYTKDGTFITGVWGANSRQSEQGPPYFDIGYALPPFPIAVRRKSVRVVVDNPPGNVVNKGDILEYTLHIDNKGLLPLVDIPVIDNPPTQQLQYLAGTTSLQIDEVLQSIPDDIPNGFNPDFNTPFPLDGVAGYSISNVILRGSSALVRFQCKIIGTGLIRNSFGTVTNTIESAVLASIGPTSVVEGNSGERDLVFTVTLDSTAEGDLSVAFATADGTALVANNDYLATNGVLVIPAGLTTGKIIVKVIGDADVEPDETLFVTLSNPVGCEISVGQALGTIINDDTSLAVTKRVVAPAGRSVAIGEKIQFAITVQHTGGVPLAMLSVADVYDTNLLSFVSATPGGYTESAGRISWPDLGGLGIGADVTAELWFTATTNGVGRNYAISATTTNAIPHINVNPRVSVAKAVTFPAGRPTAVGETNTFTITVRNIGDTVLDTVPVVDTYNAALLRFVSAVPPPSTHVGSVLTWNQVGPLATNGAASVKTLLVKFEALAAGTGTNSVTVVPITTDGVPVPPATNSVPHVNATAKRRVSKQVVAPIGRAAAIGEQIQFSINVANTGDVPIFHVPLEDAYDTNLLAFVSATPAGYTTSAGRISWADLGVLGVGADVTAELWFTAITNGIGRNYAISQTTTNAIPHINVNPRVSVAKAVTFPAGRPTAVGETNTFTITVRNIGDTVLDTVPVVDTYNAALLRFVSAVPPPSTHVGSVLTWNQVGPLATNGAASVKTLLVKFEALAAGTGTNSVIVVPITSDGVPVPPATNSVPHVNAAAKRLVSKQVVTPIGRAAAIGEQIQFSINVANTGDVPIFHVPLEDAYDTNLLAFVSATPAGYTTSAGRISWADLGVLGVGADVTAELWFTAITNGIGRNYAISQTTTNAIPHINVNPRVSVAKAVTFPAGRPTAIGETNTFTITVRNIGDTVLDTVPVVDTYNAALLRFVSAVPPPSTHVGSVLTWNQVGPLATNGAASVKTLLVKFEALAAGTGTNSVIVVPITSDGVPVPPATNSVPHVNAAAKRLVSKQVVAPIGRAAAIGEQIQFSINVANTGDVPIFHVPLEDAYDTNLLAFVSATPAGYTTSAGRISWADLGVLGVGADVTAELWFTAITNGIGRNYAISQTTTNAIPHINVNPRVSVAKAVTFPAGRPTAVGETNTFTITVRNIGDTVLDTVPVVDTYNAALLRFVSAVPPPSTHVGSVLTWNQVGPLATNGAASVKTLLVKFEALAAGTGTNSVTVVPITTDGVPVPPATNSVPHVNAAAKRLVSKQVVAPIGRAAAIGEQIQFSINVANTGAVPIFHVPLEDAYDTNLLAFVSATPAGYTTSAGRISWADLGVLGVGADVTAELWFTAITNGIGRNYAISQTTTNAIPHINVNPRVSVAKAVTFPAGRPTAVGETNTFTITVRNIGDTVLDTVPVVDTYNAALLRFVSAVPPPSTHIGSVLTWNQVGPLATNGAASVKTLLVKFEALAAGTGTNSVIVVPITSDGVPVPPATNSVPHVNAAAKRLVSKQVVAPIGRAAAIGEQIQFSINVANTGAVPIFHVPLVDSYDTNLLAFVSATPAGYTTSAGRVSWPDLGPLGVGANVTAELWFTAITNGIGRNYAISQTTTNTIPHINVNPRVSVAKAVTFPAGRPTAIGETNTFTITVRNIGDTVLDTVPVVDTYNAALLRFVSAVPPPSTHVGSVLTWNQVGPLATNGAASVKTLLVKFEALAAGTGTNSVIVVPITTDGVPVPPATNSVPHVNATAKRLVSKQVVTPIGRAVAIGEQIQFSINVANTGAVPIFHVPLEDAYDTNLLSFVSATPAGYTTSAGRISWADLGVLGVGADVTAELWFTAITNGIGRNYAISQTTTNTIPHINVNPRVSVAKAVTLPAGRPTAVGETNTFTITVRNIGDTVLDTVPVVDTYNAALLRFVSAVPPPSTHIGSVLTWNQVGPLATNGAASVKTLLVKFEALAAGTGTNSVIVVPITSDGVPVPPATNSVPHVNAAAKRLVSKQVVAPIGRAAAIGEQIQFSINVANTGAVPIFHVPLEDAYDTNLLSFVTATPAGYTTSAGRISWADLGPLGVGADVTAELWFTATTNGVGRNYAISATTTNEIPHINVNPRVSVAKAVTFPSGRPTAVGETNTFTITLRNIGDTVLDTVPVVDTYNAALLRFVSAVPPPSTHVGSVLTWNQVGPLATNGAASVKTLLVKFEALAAGTGTNSVIVVPITTDGVPVPPATNSVPHINVDPRVSIAKALVFPVGRPAQISESMVFQITVSNTGDYPLDTVPVVDTYDTTTLTYMSAVPSPVDNNNDGTLNWANVGPLARGASTNLFATFKVRAATMLHGGTNIVVTAPSTIDNVPVPAQTNRVPYFIDESVDVDNVSTGAFTFAGSGSVSHAVLESSTNHLLLVGISINNTPEARGYVKDVRYGGILMTLAGAVTNLDKVVSMWILKSPPVGVANVVVNLTRPPGEGWVVGVITFRNVDQNMPCGVFSSSIGTAGNPTLTGLSSALGEVIVDTVALEATTLNAIGAGQTQRWTRNSTQYNQYTGYATGGGSIKKGAVSVDMSWGASYGLSSNWAMGALAIRPHRSVLKAPCITVVGSSRNPSASGEVVTFNAIVPGATPLPSGTVQFKVNNVNFGSACIMIGGAAVSAATSTLAEGVHAITAHYSGDANYMPSVSSILLQSVGSAPTFVITAIRVEDGNTVLEWPGYASWNYTVDTTFSLAPFAVWSNLPGYVDIPGVTGTMSATDTNGLSNAKFYRVKMNR